MRKKLLIGLASFLLAFFLFLVWFDYTYSMEKIDTVEYNDKSLNTKVLIASQGSEYKTEIVQGVIDFLKNKSVFIKVVDVSELPTVNTNNWNAIVILHTWEIFKPEENTAEFLKDNYDNSKMFVVTTSASGDNKIDGIDGISGASPIDSIPDHTLLITDWLTDCLELEK